MKRGDKMGIVQYVQLGEKTKDGLVPMRLAYVVPFCDICGGTSELVKVHDLELCPSCAELYNNHYPKFVETIKETKDKNKKKK